MKRTFGVLAMMAFFPFRVEATPTPQAPELRENAKSKQQQMKPQANAAFFRPENLRSIRHHLIRNYVEEASALERLEPELLHAIIRVESNFNHKAISRVGAKGLMQLMPGTAQELGAVRALDPKNPRANILAGARYLRSLINHFRGNLRLAVAAYNAGPGAVERYRGIPPFAETQAYVGKVFAQWEQEKKRSGRF